MKNLLFMFFSFVLFSLYSYSNKLAEVKIYGGPNFPINSFGNFTVDESINYFVNDTTISNGKLIPNSSNIGYILGFQVALDLNDDIQFFGSLEFNRFNTKNIQVLEHNSPDLFTKIDVITTIIPISSGINYYLMKEEVFGIYIFGDLSYNFITYNLDYPILEKKLDISTTVSKGRLGCGTGFGFDYVLDKIILSINYKYNNYNFIGKDINETTMNAHSIRIGATF